MILMCDCDKETNGRWKKRDPKKIIKTKNGGTNIKEQKGEKKAKKNEKNWKETKKDYRERENERRKGGHIEGDETKSERMEERTEK